MCSKKEMKPLHVAMYPWLAMGHLTPFMHLANKLAERGHQVSFFIPIKTQLKLASHNNHLNLITFIPITVPPVDGLADGAETTNDVPACDQPKIMEAMDLTQGTIDSFLAQLKPDYLFFDFAHWLPGLARKHGVTSIFYSVTYVVSPAYLNARARNLPDDHKITEADILVAPPGFPCPAMRLRAHEARAFLKTINSGFGGGLSFSERVSLSAKECDIIAIKTCREMEGGYFDIVVKYSRHNKPFLLAGPNVPQQPSSRLDDKLDRWLNGFSHGSVVFCCLGSECKLELDKFHELVLGLELTGMPFLAGIKPPTGYETIESALPEGYSERIKGRGVIDAGWMQQQLILQHPSIGCFISHCGSGSLSEALSCECQLVMLPYALDQYFHARLMTLDLGVGVEVEKRDDDGFFTRNDIYEVVHTVMDPENEVGRMVRGNHDKWRNILFEQGLEDSYIDTFVDTLRDMLG